MLIKVLNLQFVFLVLFLSHNYGLLSITKSPLSGLSGTLWPADNRMAESVTFRLKWKSHIQTQTLLFICWSSKKAMSGISSEFLQEKLQKEFNPIHLVGEVYILYSFCAKYAHKSGFLRCQCMWHVYMLSSIFIVLHIK